MATIGTAWVGINLNSYKLLPVSFGYFKRIATDFPASVGEPPPIVITAFAPKSRASFAASSIAQLESYGVLDPMNREDTLNEVGKGIAIDYTANSNEIQDIL